ncbi:sugar phosphate isomerase/epimerase family protein [Tomitella biformata]|uniref:sugar phosphate isomerase/epimerase family protein n=1 Tax=Tomitella biformata TaxID=630403 RepID=UPI000466F033|nr:sugar phosphate isomerase/epimerase family protein [Tomitella biformata]
MRRHSIPVGLSTASVYPQKAESAFQFAAELGYDGIELMVWAEAVSQDAKAVRALIEKYDMPVQAVHAPCLLISQRVWGTDPVRRLDKAVEMARSVGATTVVVHPPFRWQRPYARGFAEQVARLEDTTGIIVAVENMFPMRADRLFGRKERSIERMGKRGGLPGPGVSAFAPGYDPTTQPHRHFTLDLSHTSTAGMDALELADRMGAGLVHVHLADGRGAYVDEHLIPGHGTQPCAELCQRLGSSGFAGQVVLEVNTQNARTRVERASMLAEALAFARQHLG